MSVLIKGMKKPDNCEICPYAFCHLDTRNCPIVELPDHGDLIDRDILLSKIQKWYWEAIETVKRMPDVIPAERSEDEADKRRTGNLQEVSQT